MKGKSKNILFFILIISFIGLILYLLFGLNQTIISTAGTGLPPETKTISWEDKSVELEAPYFGSLTSGAKYPGANNPNQDYSICGDNDGYITISNSYDSSEELVLSSLGSGRSGRGCSGNYISGKVTLPPGTLKVSCNLIATDTLDWGADAYCFVDGSKIGAVHSKGSPPKFYINGGTKTASILKEFEITETKTITVKTSGDFGSDNSYSTNMILNFEPQSPNEPPTTEPPTWTNIWNKISEWFDNLIKKILGIE